MARNNQSKMEYPKPLILFSLDKAILKAKAVNIKVRKTPVINSNEKFIAHNFFGKYLDCGTMDGYINSTKEIAKI